jgi:hypothetical protein
MPELPTSPVYLLKRAELAVRGCVEKALSEVALTPSQYFVLFLVETGEATSSAELARATQAPAPRREAPPERHTVGREQERLALRHALAEAEDRHGVLLSVEGEPGIGKTTLVVEFLADV